MSNLTMTVHEDGKELRLSDSTELCYFRLRPLRKGSDYARVYTHPNLESKNYPKSVHAWKLVNMTLVKVKPHLEDGCVEIHPHAAASIYLESLKLPITFVAALDLVISNYKKQSENKKQLEKSETRKEYNGTF